MILQFSIDYSNSEFG